MKEIIFLIEVPNKDYTNGIAESNIRLFREISINCKTYFFEDKPFHQIRFYFLSKIISILYFLKNYMLFISKRFNSLHKRTDYLYVVLSVNSPLGIIKNFFQIVLLKPFAKNIIIQIHRSDINEYKNSISIIHKIQQFILSWAYEIIVLSNKLSYSNVLKNYKDKIFVLKNTLDLKLENKLLDIRINVPENPHKTRFFFYSNILYSKGIKVYLDLFKSNINLDNAFSTVAGYPNDRVIIKDLKENNHKYIGYISNKNKPKLFLNNDCIIFTSLNEGSPLILLESMASGVFIISSNVGFIPELLGEDYPFMCSPNSKNFSEKINKYLQLSESERYSIIFNQRERYLKFFSYKKWARRSQLIF